MLQPYTIYYTRTFLTENDNVVYGNVLSFSINSLIDIVILTQQAQIISTSSVQINGSINGLGSIPLEDFGHCWATTHTPTINDSKISYGASTKDTVFGSTLEGLSLQTAYYVRTYAVLNGSNVLYGHEISFTIPDLIVTTDTFAFIGNDDVQLSGNLLQLGVNTVLQHGFCWSYATASPNINDNVLSLGSAQNTGVFSVNMSIINGVKYYYRAYATDGVYVKYGSVKQFEKN